MEVNGQIHATGNNPDTHSVGGCLGPRVNPGGFKEESISKKIKQLFKKF
jgi:hypothetical protein